MTAVPENLITACVQMRAAVKRFRDDLSRDPGFVFPAEHAALLVELEDFFVWSRTKQEMKKGDPEPISAFEKLNRACVEMAGEIAMFMAAVAGPDKKISGVPSDLVEIIKALRHAFTYLDGLSDEVTTH